MSNLEKNQNIQNGENTHLNRENTVKKLKKFLFEQKGDSMDNGRHFHSIQDGWCVEAVEYPKSHWHNIVNGGWYVIIHIDGCYIKKIVGNDIENNTIVCNSINPNKEKYPDFRLNLTDCLEIFEVTAVNPDGMLGYEKTKDGTCLQLIKSDFEKEQDAYYESKRLQVKD